MGESQRGAPIAELANLALHPESVPINHLRKWRARRWPSSLIWTPGFVRTVAVARITMPKARVRPVGRDAKA